MGDKSVILKNSHLIYNEIKANLKSHLIVSIHLSVYDHIYVVSCFYIYTCILFVLIVSVISFFK